MRISLFLLLASGLVSTAQAVQTGVLVDEGYSDLFKGELTNVSLSHRGELTSAPGLVQIASLDEPAIWAVATHPQGGFVVGTGNAGKVLRVSTDGAVEELFAPDSILARGLVVDENGDIYVGTSPNGAIYRLPAEGGKPQIHFDPEDLYIWDLAIEEGALWITTGFPARLLRLPLHAGDDVEAEEWFRAKDDHLMSMRRRGDEWLVGSSSRGILYAVKSPQEARALFKANEKEIRAIGLGENDSILLSTFSDTGGSDRLTPSDELPPLVVSASAGSSGSESSSRAKTSPQHGRGLLIRIDAEGIAQAEWRSGEGGIFALAPIDPSLWLLGFSREGKLFGFSDRHHWELLHQMPRGGEISEIVPAPTGESGFYVFTSNPAVVYRLGGAAREESRFQSRVLDARQSGRWGRMETTFARPGEVLVETRSGFTDEPDSTWSGWDALEDGMITSPASRFLQYRLTFPAGSEASFLRTRVFHALPNVAPVIVEVRVLNFGVEVRTPSASSPLFDFSAAFQASAMEMLGDTSRTRIQLERRSEGSLRTIVWRASDPNGDGLTFDVSLRKAGAREWTVLARQLTEPAFVFNSAGMEPGYYQARVLASDEVSNSPEDAQTTEFVSDLVLVDASSPIMHTVENDDNRLLIVEVDGGVSRLVAAQIIIDGGEPVRLRPTDGLFDSPRERFEYRLPDDAQGPISVIFEVLDESGNQAAHVIRVPAS